MKDAVLLLVTGLVCAGIGWTFWHFLDSDALGILTLITMLVLVADNLRLRRQLAKSSR